MDKYVIIESEKDEPDYIIDKLVEYNLSKVPLRQKKEFININRTVKNVRYLEP